MLFEINATQLGRFRRGADSPSARLVRGVTAEKKRGMASSYDMAELQ
ncbi:MAG: hypothetical protein ACO2PM_11260 [Pyrobaculum sp.]